MGGKPAGLLLDVERGEINPTFRIMLKLTRGLDVPLSKLIRDYETLRREQQ
jgi:transcriptional regulator with XRE-family HTH domain